MASDNKPAYTSPIALGVKWRILRETAQGRRVIEVGRRRRGAVDGAVKAEALARVLDVLKRR